VSKPAGFSVYAAVSNEHLAMCVWIGVRESAFRQSLTQENDMLRKHMAACLVASALALVPAMAQTTGSGSGAGGSAGGTAGGGGAGTSGNFIDRQQPGQMLASRQLIGATVVGPNNERVGDVNDVLLDRNGQAVAIVVGVGGFLGIGEKDVAVSFREVQFTPRNQGGGAGTGGAGGTGGPGSSGSANPGTGAGAGPGTGNGGAAGAGTGGASGTTGMTDQIMIRMSRQDLQNAPTFARAGSTGGTGGAGGTATGGASRPAGTGAGSGSGAGGASGPGGTGGAGGASGTR
jgi:sporulation protein YlmC with PRC-barrel domain